MSWPEDEYRAILEWDDAARDYRHWGGGQRLAAGLRVSAEVIVAGHWWPRTTLEIRAELDGVERCPCGDCGKLEFRSEMWLIARDAKRISDVERAAVVYAAMGEAHLAAAFKRKAAAMRVSKQTRHDP